MSVPINPNCGSNDKYRTFKGNKQKSESGHLRNFTINLDDLKKKVFEQTINLTFTRSGVKPKNDFEQVRHPSFSEPVGDISKQAAIVRNVSFGLQNKSWFLNTHLIEPNNYGSSHQSKQAQKSKPREMHYKKRKKTVDFSRYLSKERKVEKTHQPLQVFQVRHLLQFINLSWC